MVSKCFLETDGYQIIFELNSIENNQELVNLVIELRLDPQLGEMLVRSVPSAITFPNLQRLVSYFEQHIAALRADPNYESPVFLTNGLGFQMQALAGEFFTEVEGNCNIRVMLNVGKPIQGYASTYIGGESVVEFAQIHSFISGIKVALQEIGWN
ncbi:MAG: hypothetical protein F6K21_00285 [Symploca sp. SIO2D2]|nr:hypothetical protein [Symploca sp. SIO2D2]NER21860.1 hypothetical protein [Symploca sp. SIO1C2]NER50893.1 hypothetical protein [Symploca sp. SIO1A3]